MGLQLLSMLLHKHYSKECIIIIDEYDTPIQQGHSCNFYSEIVNFMRNFFSGGLKDNPHLAFGFLTGILRVAKESIFSGMNNLKINSILDESYSEYFGFTKEEVKDMLCYYGKKDKFQEICEWYDGYRLCAVLGNRYRIRSNREAGLGRFDIQLSPLVSGIPGFLFEFKHTKDERVNLAVLADSALQQINEKKYDTELRNAGVNSIIKIGIAFRGKNAVVKRG